MTTRPEDLKAIFGGKIPEEILQSNGQSLTWEEATSSQLLSGQALRPFLELPTDYLIEPWVVRGAITQIQGDPKAGKSVFALYLSIAASMGHSHEYLSVGRPLNVLYLHYEDATTLLARRIDQFMRGLKHPYGTMPANLTICYFPRLDLGSMPTKKLLQDKCKELAIDLLVIDTLSYVHAAEENSASEMRLVMYALKQISFESKIGIIYLHHTAKGSDERAMVQRGRGSGVITAAADIVVHWGDRNGTDTTPVEVQSKFESQVKLSIDYIKMALEEGEPQDRLIPVRWQFRDCEDGEATEERAKCLIPVAQEYEKTSPEGISSTQLKLLSKLKDRTFYKYLKICLDLGFLIETGQGRTKRYYASK